MSGRDADNPDAQAAFGAPSEGKRASTRGYWLAGLIAFAAITGAIAWFVAGFTGLDDRVGELQRVPVGGAQVVTLEEGANAIYYESAAGEDANVPPLDIGLAPEGGGAEVVIGPHGGDVQYSVGGHAGRSIAGFEIEQAGRYGMAVSARGERVAPEAVLAVGKGVGSEIVRAVVGGIVIFLGGLLLSGVVIIVTAKRRRA